MPDDENENAPEEPTSEASSREHASGGSTDNSGVAPADDSHKLFADVALHEIDPALAMLPWILSPRLSVAAYEARCARAGIASSVIAHMRHLRLTDEELALYYRHNQEHECSGDEKDFAACFLIRNYGGKTRVGWFNVRGQLETMSHDEFRKAHREKIKEIWAWDDKAKANKLVAKKKLADYWLDHPGTRRYDRVEFLPGASNPPEGVMNLWRGWPEWFKPGWSDFRLTNNGPVPVTDGLFDGEHMPGGYCDLFLAHMREFMCADNDEVYRFLLGWIADMLNNPGPSPVAIILRSDDEGTGKGFWAKQIMKFVGPHGVTLNNPRHVVGNFNAHLMNKSFLYADEAFFAGNHQHAASLKVLITDDELFIEPKGVDGFMAPKHWRLVMSSNDPHVVRASAKARRFLVLNVDAGSYTDDKEYFGQMDDELRAGGLAALGRWLTGTWWREQVGENRFKRWKIPVTKALREQQDLSLNPVERAVFNMLALGEPPCAFHREGEGVFVPTIPFKERAKLGEESVKELGALLAALESRGTAKENRRYVDGRQCRGSLLPSLGVCRRRFEEHLGRAVPWPEGVVDWATQGVRGDSTDIDGAPF